MKVSVLGTEYEIIFTTDTENDELKGADGFCAYYDKYILVETNLFRDDNRKVDKENSKEVRTKHILRHEILHAFVSESGLRQTSLDEEWAVDWMAEQFPKMLEVFEKVGAI